MSTLIESAGLEITDELAVLELVICTFPGVKAADETTCFKRKAERNWNFMPAVAGTDVG